MALSGQPNPVATLRSCSSEWSVRMLEEIWENFRLLKARALGSSWSLIWHSISPTIFRLWRDCHTLSSACVSARVLNNSWTLFSSFENPLFKYCKIKNINLRIFLNINVNARWISFILSMLMKLCCDSAMKFRQNATYKSACSIEKNFRRYFHLYHVSYTFEMYDLQNEFSDKCHFLSHKKFQKLDIEYQSRYQCHTNALITAAVMLHYLLYLCRFHSTSILFKDDLASWDLKDPN